MKIVECLFILIKRFFHVDITKRQKIRNRLALISAAVCISVLLTAGYTVVYARSYAVMNNTPIVVWDVSRQDGETAVTFLGQTVTF